ncbi:unnamed protein product [Camellia sinensis]
MEPLSDLLLSLSLHTYTPKSKMYMAYGWPEVIRLESGPCPSSERIIYLKLTDRLLLVVAPSHLELWSSSQAQGETGVVQERFGLDSERRREYTGHLESVCQIDCCSCRR